MLELLIPDSEYFNEKTNKFVIVKGGSVKLEHSLISISKWESKWVRPFLSDKPMTPEEQADYIRQMTIGPVLPFKTYLSIGGDLLREVNEYINAPMTALSFPKTQFQGRKDSVTSETIYHWMFSLGIPIECEKWHLNRLFALIRYINAKNNPGRKMSARELARRNNELNQARMRRYGTSG